jgi:hypothetical protein
VPAHRLPRWTPHELAILRDHYPEGGAEAVRPMLPTRSWRSIYVMAHRLGYRRPPATTNAVAPGTKLQGEQLEEAIRLRETEGWSFARIGERFGVAESSANSAILIALCRRKGFTPAERDARGCLTPQGLERVRLALRKGMKGVDIQLRLGLSASRVAEERRRYNADLKARGKVPLPPPNLGAAYSGTKLTPADKRAVEALFMQGLGSKKIHARTGVSITSIGRIRARLVKRLRRKGETLPGCDRRGTRHVQAESSRFVPEASKAILRALLLERVPVRRAAALTAVGACTAYRIRDALAAELAARGEVLPKPKLPGRIRGGGYTADPVWPPHGVAGIYAFRELLAAMPFDDAKAEWQRRRRAELDAERRRPKSFEEQLERIGRGEIGIAPALARNHLDTTQLRREERPPIAA